MRATTDYTATNESSVTEFNYFYLTGETQQVYGAIISLNNGVSGGGTSDVEIQVNSKTLRVVLE